MSAFFIVADNRIGFAALSTGNVGDRRKLGPGRNIRFAHFRCRTPGRPPDPETLTPVAALRDGSLVTLSGFTLTSGAGHFPTAPSGAHISPAEEAVRRWFATTFSTQIFR